MRDRVFITLVCMVCGSLIWASNPIEDISREMPDNLLMEDQQPVEDVADTLAEPTGSSDSAYAVDDEIWRQLRVAQEYFAQGVAANQEANWQEAQYYLERALGVMALMDIDTVESTPEAKKYNSLLNEIVADYRLTLLSLGSLPEDASPSVFLEKYSSMKTFGEISVDEAQEEKPVTYDIPIIFNDRVKKSIIYFQTVARDAFERYLTRSGKYIPLMQEIIKQYGIPNDLVYLPLIESGFNCKAYSWARALGPWQFIASTGKLYDLDRNWWYDERRDFVKSTHAAARFLRDLYDKFGKWELALAAYNGGPGRIERTIKSQRTSDFWDMDLRQQTEDYVPFFMAATIIAKNPNLYGFHINYDDPIAFEEVTLDRCVELRAVADATGVSVEHLRELNPELLRDVTPPKVKNYKLRIPSGKKDRFLAAVSGMTSPKETDWVRHKIKRGETIASIANKYGVSQYAVLEANGLSSKSKIIAGKTLIVPVPMDISVSEPSSPKPRQATGDNTYIVRKGDNLWSISESFDTSPEAIRRLNYMGTSSRIYVGQVLRLPGAPPVAAKQPARAEVRASTETPGGEKTYKVKRGDTLWDIARRFGTTTSTLRRLNDLGRSARIFVGQTIQIAGGGSLPDDYLIYIVRKGDTLSDIARAFQTSVESIKMLNGIGDAGKLKIGSQLKIAKE